MIQPKRKRTRPASARVPSDEATLARLAAKYTGGASIRTLVTETGWAYGTVHRRLHLAAEAGMTTVRGRGGRRPRAAE